jgi:DNA-binding NarL/FixJ family response regulator
MSNDASTARRGSEQERLRGEALNQEDRLTKREREILGFFAEGFGTEAIARRLSISRVTVRNHAQRILAKLRVHSRLAAVAHGYRDGLIGKLE